MEVHVVHVAEPAEVLAQSRALALPAADADVDVVALGEDPRVAAGDDSELEHQPAAVARVERCVALEAHAVSVVAGDAERAGGEAVDAVGTDDHACGDPLAVDADVPVVEPDLHTVAKLCAGILRLTNEELVQPATLRHEAERLVARALEGGAIAEPQLEAVDDVLDDRVERERKQPRRAQRDSAAAGLVAREAGLVDEQHRGAAARKPVRGRRACGPGADDDRVETLHALDPTSSNFLIERVAWPMRCLFSTSAKRSEEHTSELQSR